jgi:hypothetical protein
MLRVNATRQVDSPPGRSDNPDSALPLQKMRDR